MSRAEILLMRLLGHLLCLVSMLGAMWFGFSFQARIYMGQFSLVDLALSYAAAWTFVIVWLSMRQCLRELDEYEQMA